MGAKKLPKTRGVQRLLPEEPQRHQVFHEPSNVQPLTRVLPRYNEAELICNKYIYLHYPHKKTKDKWQQSTSASKKKPMHTRESN